jgi:NADPH:quinone reductase-like Zn-dependent oxidoreductase
MKAVQISQYGDANVLSVKTDAPKPKAGEGLVLVEVHAASINPVDTAIRLGYMAKMAPLSFPATLGMDAAGVVVEVGSGVGFQKGQGIQHGRPPGGGHGAFAEYAAFAGTRAIPRADFTGGRPSACRGSALESSTRS